jgi:hypothetical protein
MVPHPTRLAGDQHSCPDLDELSLFISFPAGSFSALHPCWPPAWLPSLCPFYNSAENQSLYIVFSSSSKTWEGTSELELLTDTFFFFLFFSFSDQA